MEDIAAKRREKVAKLKKIFIFVKLGFMFLLSCAGSAFFVWTQYYNAEAARQIKRGIEPSIELCLKYCKENDTLVTSSVVCCVIAGAFVAFLIAYGVQTLIERWIMRHANTGGR